MEALTLSQPKESKGEVLLAATGSFLFHGLVIAMAVFLPAMLPKPIYKTPYYSVNLVNMKELGVGSGAVPKNAKHTAASPAHVSKRVHGAASQTINPSSMIPVKRLRFRETPMSPDNQIQRLNVPQMPEVPVTSENNSVLDKQMDQLISRPKPPALPATETKQTNPSPSKTAPQSTANATKKAAGGSSVIRRSTMGGQIGLARRLYYTEVWSAIRSQWALPEFLKSRQLEAVLVLTVRRDGKIISIRFEKKSGNTLFDESVLRAVRKANPLPAFPEIYSPPEERIGVRFRPQDLQ